MTSNLISCPDCEIMISPDAETCPTCGRVNDWVHPVLDAVRRHLEKQDFVTEYEMRGHEMWLHSQSSNARQTIGRLLMFTSMILLVGGIFSPTLLSLALLSLVVGGTLTLFGLSAFTPQELHIDLRKSGKTVGQHNSKFWADVLAVLHENSEYLNTSKAKKRTR